MATAFVIVVSVVLGLLLFLLHEVRRFPGPPQWGRSPKWGKRIRVILVCLPLVIALLVFWGVFIEPGRLVTRQQTIKIDKWPNELRGLKIAVLSDIHAGGWFVDEKKLHLIVERTNQLQPDLIVILGDYLSGEGWMSHRMLPETFGPVLKDFRAPLGVYSVLGNHDWWWDGARVRRGLEANGIKVLDDEVLEVKTHGSSFWLVGLADFWTRPQYIEQTISKVPDSAAVIAITHNPDIFPRLPQRVQLLLAGHTHGGQVQFPFIGSVVQASDFGDRYLQGHVVENGHHLFVTTGIGTSIMPIRFGVPPEIYLVTLE